MFNQSLGTINAIKYREGYGFIRSVGGGNTIFFHKSDFSGYWLGLRENDRVLFSLDTYNQKVVARNVSLCLKLNNNQKYIGRTLELTESARKRALEDIANWKLEAKLDDLKKYFFIVPQMERVVSGQAAYVIGRKGTGKTALAHYIENEISENSNIYVKKLTFKNFPFNELYLQDNKNYTRPNQYITIWKLIIYSFACRLLSTSSSVSLAVKRKINKAFPEIQANNLGTLVRSWIASGFGVNILGNGFSIGNLIHKKEYSVQEKVENLEKFLINNIGDLTVIILFDELDEDYKNIVEQLHESEYIDLLTSLFKAAQDIRAIFNSIEKKLLPVIFLRDDIYDLIQDSDKNKWRDFEVVLEWSEEGIKEMLSYRFSRVYNTDEKDFDVLWYSLFSHTPLTYSRKNKKIRSYSYMRMSTHGRPRDFINYLKECASIELRNSSYEISNDTVKKADKSYSNYLRRELIDEIHGAIQDIAQILSIFSETRKSILSVTEFKDAYMQRVNNGNLKIKNADVVLRTLFYFSVIGNVSRSGARIFKHEIHNAELNFKEKIIVHRGLMKALQII